MTLPFRGRHHDDETAHDRAHTLTSAQLVEPLSDEESAWLARHLDGCAECRRDRNAFVEDRALLRALRDAPPEAPRDLWARTSAALDREARHRARPGAERSGAGRPTGWRALPLGAAAGALVLLVAFAAVFLQGPRPLPPSGTSGPTLVAVVSEAPSATGIAIDAAPISFVRAAADGTLEIVTSRVDAVCPPSEPKCKPPISEGSTAQVKLASKASRVTISPRSDQLVVEPANEAGSLGRILVMPVPKAAVVPTARPTEGPTAVPATPGGPTETPTLGPSQPPTPEPTPEGQIEIATGVTIVGDLAYSADGAWLAFSAQPVDGSTGPDLYLWSVGSPMATQVTTDHQTYFSAWLGNQVLASSVAVATETPGASGEPGASDGSAGRASTPPDETAGSEASGSPGASDEPTIEPIVGHPSSFVLDPATLTRTDFQTADVWLPVVDPTSTRTAYWAGTLLSSNGIDWTPGEGALVLDGWATGSEAPTATGEGPPSTAAPTSGPTGSAAESPTASVVPLGPLGSRRTVVPGPIGAFRARFDPEGSRVAVWVAEEASAGVGRLHLLVIDPTTGNVDPTTAPLQGEPALRAFSIDEGRLAWVSPDGQDGAQSAVKVLGWQDSTFGEIQTRSGTDILIVR